MLVVAEHELIEIEKLYAIAQSIPMDDKSKMISKLSLKNENKISSDNFKNKLQQWRIMFYCKQFFDLNVEELKTACKGQLNNLYIQIRIFDFITPMKLADFSKVQNDDNEEGAFEINKMRVHYFFTDTKEVMKSFLTNTEIELRVTEGMNWNKPIAIASSFALQYFKVKTTDDKTYNENNEDLLVQRQGLQLHFFGSKITNFQMHMTIGIKEDLKIKTENIMLYRFNDVFFPDNSYYNSDPLPVEWIEVFQENQALKEMRIQQKQNKDDLNASKEISLFPKEDDKLTLSRRSKSKERTTKHPSPKPPSTTHLEKYNSADKRNSSSKQKTGIDETDQKEINGSSQAVIKKTLQIYSIISKVNEEKLKDEIGNLAEENTQDNNNQYPFLAIEPAPEHTENRLAIMNGKL